MIRLTLFIVPLGIIYILCACAISPAEVFAAPTSVRPNRRGSDGSSDGLLSDDSLAVPVSVLRAVYRPVQVYDHHPTSSDSSSTLSTPCTSSDTGAGVGVRDDHDRDSENSSAGQPDKRELLVSVPFLDSPSPVIVHPRHGTDPRAQADLNEMMESHKIALILKAESVERSYEVIRSKQQEIVSSCIGNFGYWSKTLEETRQLRKEYAAGRSELALVIATFRGMLTICENLRSPGILDAKRRYEEAQSASRNGQSARQDAQPAQSAHRDDLPTQSAHRDGQPAQAPHRDDHSVPQDSHSAHRDGQPAHQDSQCANRDGQFC